MSSYQPLIDLSQKWLMETAEPGPRYLAMRDLYSDRVDEISLEQAALEAHQHGPIARILDRMSPDGWWSKPGPGYSPKYRSTVWAIILLGQLGASLGLDMRLTTSVTYLFEHAYAEGGYFSHSGAPSGTFDCLQGNLTWALLALGVKDPRLDEAIEWMARSQTGEGVASRSDKNAPLRYYSAKSGPNFTCGANGNAPCAWGAAKVMLAFSKVAKENRSELVQRAINLGIEYFFNVDPAAATWNYQERISRNWWKFGFPVFYNTDLLQVAESLSELGYANDPRMASLIKLIEEKQIEPGRWSLDYSYEGKTWGNYGEMGQPNKWITIRALRVLKAVNDQT